ncbi:MAG: lytic transglycosylase domain-containing protein [Deltaproteobacteria bacterium]|nr:lytic transglycosylase domain-containing protein [Deltaproteobacteria bacterium]
MRAIFALSAVSIAILPAILEHDMRLDRASREAKFLAQERAIQEARAQSFQNSAAGTDSSQDAPVYSLSPNVELVDQVASRIHGKPNFDKKAGRYEEIIQEAAQENSVSPVLVKAVIQAESRFNPGAISSQGAVGLMQILPSTARSMGFSSPQIPRENVRAGVRYLKVLLDEFGDEEALAIAAYNCGPDNVKRYGNQMPPFHETRVFVSQVMEYYQSHIQS